MRLKASAAVIVVFAFLFSDGTLSAEAQAGSTALVSNSNNSGPGSFRAAVLEANGDPGITRIQFTGGVGVVTLQQTVVFTGAQGLTIAGAGATLDGTRVASGPAFLATGGGDLTLFHLAVQHAPTEGIAIAVPSSATGTVRVELINLDILDNGGHGVLVNDQDNPTGDPNDAGTAGSPASVDVRVVSTLFKGNGFTEGLSDLDGLRVNEGGPGDLSITVLFSKSEDNGADGIEADERGSGDVHVEMFGSAVTGNGEHDPSDLDDGFDIDENQDGDIVGLISLSAANDNFEEGFDFNENHAGDLRVDMLFVEAKRNGEEGIDYEEDDDFAGGGDLVTRMAFVTANGNAGGDAGLKIREKGVGDLDVTLSHTETSDNETSGIQIREDANGSLLSAITWATSTSNDGHGIDFDENRESAGDASGDLTASVTRSDSSNNSGAGVRADQQTPPGAGSLVLTRVTLNGNGGGSTTGNNVVVTIN
jgi:hypothetical protein